MIKRMFSLAALAFATTLGHAQTSAPAKHYRLDFQIVDPTAATFKNVNIHTETTVSADTPGSATVNYAMLKPHATPPGPDPQNRMTFTCTEIRQSGKGLTLQVKAEITQLAGRTAPGTEEQIVQSRVIEKSVDLSLGAPASLLSGSSGSSASTTTQTAPETANITVIATEI